jgi:hypothetical protein
VVTAGAPENATPQAVLDSYRPGLVVVTAIAAAGLLITLTGLRTPRRPQRSVVVAKSPVQEAERVTVRD